MKKVVTVLLFLTLLSCGEENVNQDDQANVQVEPTKEEAEHLKEKLEPAQRQEEAQGF